MEPKKQRPTKAPKTTAEPKPTESEAARLSSQAILGTGDEPKPVVVRSPGTPNKK